jgi:hypothetical protein
VTSQEYELAFVTALPQGVLVVDAHTLDFSKNPAGALAFRYKHGWILINPLVPSRGLSGGGLARQHGHLSGGHTVGHFLKGADGKMHFKATDRYASKEDWQKAVRDKAASVGVKQEAVKAAVNNAEAATDEAAKLESAKAPKAAQAAAHQAAAVAHQDAAKAFQSAGEGPVHKSGALTHSAHGAIHASKADQLGQEAKTEGAAKLEARKKLAGDMSAKANDASLAAKAQNEGLLKEKVAAHAEAEKAHKAAQKVNEAAGNHYVAEAHGKAAEKHGKIAANNQAAHDKIASAADATSAKAHTASESALQAQQDEPLPEAITAHKEAAGIHGQAASLHSSIGNKDKEQEHLTAKAGHNASVANLSAQKAKHDEANAHSGNALDATKDALKANQAVGNGTGTVDQQIAAQKKAAELHGKAAGAHGVLGNKQEENLHQLQQKAHTSAARSFQAEKNDLAAKNEAAVKAKNEAEAASKKAHQEGTTEAHDAALNAHIKAAVASKAAGHGPEAQDAHKGPAKVHAEAIKKIKADEGAAAEAQAKQAEIEAKAEAAYNKGLTAGDAGKHAEAAQHFQEAAQHAKDGDLKNLKAAADHHAEKNAGKAEAEGLSTKAFTDSEKIPSAGDAHTAHLNAAESHANAAMAHNELGNTEQAQKHKDYAKLHLSSAQASKADQDAAQKAAGVPKPPQNKAAGGMPLKPVGELTSTGRTLGTHGSQLMKDEAGHEWLKKTDEYSRSLDPAVASLQRKIGMDTPVFVKTKDGHLQGMLPDAKDAFPGGNFDPEKLSEDDLMKMLQHQVIDYTIGNQDSHSGQWLRTSDGKIIQIDQGQAFKFGVNSDPTKTYPPLGSDVPVYPKLWNAAKAGKVQIPDPNGDNDFAAAIKAVQDMPDDQFKALFKPYAVQALKNGHNPGGHTTVDGFLDDITKHKNSISKDFGKLYNDLPETGKAGTKAAQVAQADKTDALDEIKAEGSAGKPLSSALIRKAKASGASLMEISQAHIDGKNTPPTAPEVSGGLTAKEKALKAVAEHEDAAKANEWTHSKSIDLEEKAQAAGASMEEIQKAFSDPVGVAKALAEKEAKAVPEAKAADLSGLSGKDTALHQLASYAHNPPEHWSTAHYQDLKKAASAAGASGDELHAAMYSGGTVLKHLEAKAKKGQASPVTGAGKPTGKVAAMKALAEHMASKPNEENSPEHTALMKAAADAGATPLQIKKLNTKPAAYLKSFEKAQGHTTKEDTLKALADLMAGSTDDYSPTDYTALKTVAESHGASPEEIKKVILDPEGHLAKASPAAPAKSGISKEDALKAFAEHNLEGNANWTMKKHKELQEQALAAGVTPEEAKEAFSDPAKVLQKYGEPAAPAAPAAAPAKAEASKPKMKWSKTTHGVKVGEGHQDTPGLAGPKGLVVHKPITGTKGFIVSTADGYKLAGKTFKTQKEAKLAAEWFAANFGNNHVTKASVEDFQNADPEAYGKLKQGIEASAWNNPEGSAEAAPSSASAASTTSQLTEKEAALKALAELSLPDAEDDWSTDKELDLTKAAQAAGANSEEISAALNKPKTYLKSLGGKTGPASAPAKTIMFTGLSNDKVANAALLKQLYDQAHGPNATADMKAQYEKAQQAWQSKHSSGPFDPAKYVAPSKPLKAGANLDEIAKKNFPTSHAAGFVMVPANESANGTWKPTAKQSMGPKMYTTNAGYTGMNEQLRGEKIYGYDDHGNYVVVGTKTPKGYPAGSQWDKYIKSSDDAFQAVPPLDKDIVTVRVMEGYKPFDAYPPPMTPGASYTDMGYGSTSKKVGTWSGDFHMEIQIPAGRKVIDLNHTTGSEYTHENEILLNRGSTFKVVSDTMVGGKRKVVVQLVNDGHFG